MMNKILIIIIAFAAFIAITGCQPETSGPQNEEAVIFKDGSSLYKVVRPGNANLSIIEFAERFKTKLSKASGCTIGITSDHSDASTYEILIGETNRKESVKLYEDISNLSIDGYIIRVNGNKLLIGGANEYMVYCGLGHVLEQITSNGNEKSSLILSNDYEYISGNEISMPTPEDIISSGSEFTMYPVEKVVSLSQVGNFTVLQGGGTDGKYAYYAFLDKGTDTAVIVKIDIATWGVVKTSGPLNTGHTNDITYNPELGKLVVNNSNDSWCGISFIDPETLTESGYRVNTISSRGISYIEETSQYVLGGVYDFYIVDSEFNLQKQFTCGNPQYTTQGLFCDGKYIYDARYNSDDKTNYITINNIDGTYAGTADIPGVIGESENIFRIGNEFYIAYNKTFVVYRSVLLPASW